MNTWRDGQNEYTTDESGEVWAVRRNFEREAQEAADRQSRLRVMRFNVWTRIAVFTLLAGCVVLLAMQLIGG